MASNPLQNTSFFLYIDDSDSLWLSDAVIQLGGKIVNSSSDNPTFIVSGGSTMDEVLLEYKKLSPSSKFVTKAFLLDTIADSALPTNLSTYSLQESMSTKSKKNNISIDNDQDDLPERKQSAKRTIGEVLLSELDIPQSKYSKPSTEVLSPQKVKNDTKESHNLPKSSESSSAVVPESPFKPVTFSSIQMKWEKVDGTLLVYSSKQLSGSSKIAAFDMDGTLIVPKSGAKFPANRNDWKWMLAEVVPKLKQLVKDGFKIVIFSNQAGISKGKQNPEDLKGKITDMCSETEIPIQAFMASSSDKFRKPSDDMWKIMVSQFNEGISVDLKKSFYVGDAAGRGPKWAPGKPSDHGVGDRKFAANVGIDFFTPEEFFLGEKPAPFMWRTPNPQEVIEKSNSLSFPPGLLESIGKKQELVLMVGIQASGKSTFVQKYLEPAGYVRINRDTLGTQDKCLKATEAALKSGKSAVIDNTNPASSVRAEYIKLAKKYNVEVRVFWMQTSLELAQHCNLYREKMTKNAVKRISSIAYNMYRSKFQQPDTKEGIDQIIKIPWIAQFDDPSHQELFLHWTE